MDKTPELTAEDKARLETWRKLWATKVTEPEVIPNWQEVHDICEESYAALPPNYGFFHLICSPEVINYGPRIYIVGNVTSKCMCNILHQMDPTFEKMHELITNGINTCHEHWLVAMEKRDSDKKHRYRYMDKYFGKGNARLLKIEDPNHFLNTLLYILGSTSSNGVACHNFGMGLSQETKKAIRTKVMEHNDKYKIKKEKLSRFYKRTAAKVAATEEDNKPKTVEQKIADIKLFKSTTKAYKPPARLIEPMDESDSESSVYDSDD